MDELENKIIKLFDDGHGAQSIACILNIRSGMAVKTLKKYGRRRTRAEAYAIKDFFNQRPRGKKNDLNK